MTANTSRLGAALYNTESSFAENTNTYTTRIQTVGEPNVDGLTLAKVNTNPTTQRPHEGIADVNTIYGGSFRTEMLLTGRGATGTSLTQTDLGTLLGHVVGNTDATSVGALITTATDQDTYDATGVVLPAGALCRVGALGDGRAEGQFSAVSTETGDTVELLTETVGLANTSDTIFPAIQVYPSETPGTFETVQSLRWRLLTANNQYNCHGCFPTAIEFPNLNIGEVPRVAVDWGVSWFENANVTFPDATSTDAKDGAPIAAGSLFINDVGTTTSAIYDYRSLSIRIEHEVVPITGCGGVDANQGIVSVRRIRSKAMITVVFDAEASGTQTWQDLYDNDSGSLQHILWSGSVEDGRAIGFYFPNAKIMDPRPTQADVDGLNRITVNFEALTGPTTTTDLTLSNWRLAMG